MVRASAAVALDWGKGRCVQRTPGRWRTRGETATSAVGAGAREVSEPATVLIDGYKKAFSGEW